MEKECGEEWGSKIKDIGHLFLKDRAQFVKNRKLTQLEPNQNLKIGGLVPLIINENSWPFEDRNSNVEIHAELMQLTTPFEKGYLA